MALRRIFYLWLILLLLLTACSEEEVTPTPLPPTSAPTSTVVPATETPVPTATTPAIPTATVTATPILPAIEVEDQSLADDGRLNFSNVTSPGAGWLVILNEDGAEAGDIIGQQTIIEGSNPGIIVEVDPFEATETLYSRLHWDLGTEGAFEFPGPDTPMENSFETIEQSFTVEFAFTVPSIDVVDQEIAYDGIVYVDEVVALEPGWLVVHSYKDEKVGEPLGQVPIEEGSNGDLAFPIRWREASSQLLAVMYEDVEQPGGFDDQVDVPMLFGGESIIKTFHVSLPPDITFFDQPVIENKIILERASSRGPGWIVVYFDEGGQPGRIIGSAYLEDGVNEMIEVEVDGLAATPQLYLLLHADTGKEGEFEFPIADLPVIGDEQPLPPFPMQSVPGNYLITEDQPLGEDSTATIRLVVADIDTWVVIYEIEPDGELGEVITQIWVPAGLNRAVVVELPPGTSGKTVMAGLHLDRGVLESFDYPDGADVLLYRNFLPIQSPFTLLPADGDAQPLP